jgi:sugar phosphate isomerase/epimerase
VRDTELACDISDWGTEGFANALTDIRRAGFAGIEADVSLVPAFEDRAHVIREMLDFENLALVTLHTRLRQLSTGSAEEEGERCLNVARFLKSMACEMLVLSGPPVVPGAGEEEWLLFMNLLSDVGRRAGEMGVRLVLAPEVGTIVGNRAELERATKAFPAKSLPLAMDAGFLSAAALAPAGALRKYRARLAHLYLSDVSAPRGAGKSSGKGRKAKSGRPTTHRVALGKGRVSIERFLDAATAAGYDGWVTVRLSPADVRRDSAGAAARAFQIAGEALDLV